MKRVSNSETCSRVLCNLAPLCAHKRCGRAPCLPCSFLSGAASSPFRVVGVLLVLVAAWPRRVCVCLHGLARRGCPVSHWSSPRHPSWAWRRRPTVAAGWWRRLSPSRRWAGGLRRPPPAAVVSVAAPAPPPSLGPMTGGSASSAATDPVSGRRWARRGGGVARRPPFPSRAPPPPPPPAPLPP